jgi:hypothetical protein
MQIRLIKELAVMREITQKKEVEGDEYTNNLIFVEEAFSISKFY